MDIFSYKLGQKRGGGSGGSGGGGGVRLQNKTFNANGTGLVEMDTGKIFFYDEANKLWHEFT